MRHIFRIFIFSFFAMFITSYWNKGFILPNTALEFVKASVTLTILFALVRPLMKIIFLPLNLITFGLFSFVLYIFVLHLLVTMYSLFTIHSWHFSGFSLVFITIPQMNISYVGNLVLSSFSLSSIISGLDQLT